MSLTKTFQGAATQTFLGNLGDGSIVENKEGYGARPALGNDLKETVAPATSPLGLTNKL